MAFSPNDLPEGVSVLLHCDDNFLSPKAPNKFRDKDNGSKEIILPWDPDFVKDGFQNGWYRAVALCTDIDSLTIFEKTKIEGWSLDPSSEIEVLGEGVVHIDGEDRGYKSTFASDVILSSDGSIEVVGMVWPSFLSLDRLDIDIDLSNVKTIQGIPLVDILEEKKSHTISP